MLKDVISMNSIMLICNYTFNEYALPNYRVYLQVIKSNPFATLMEKYLQMSSKN